MFVRSTVTDKSSPCSHEAWNYDAIAIREAVLDITRRVVPRALEPIDFHRENPSCSVVEILGVVINAINKNCGITGAREDLAVRYAESPTKVPSQSTVTKQIKSAIDDYDAAPEDKRSEIVSQFRGANDRVIDFANEIDLLPDEVALAVDKGEQPYHGEERWFTQKSRNPASNNDHVIQFSVLSITDKNAPFILTARVDEDRDKMYDRLKNGVKRADRLLPANITCVLADSGYSESDSLDTVRRRVENLVFGAAEKDNSQVKHCVKVTPAEEAVIYTDVSYEEMNHELSLAVQPIIEEKEDEDEDDEEHPRKKLAEMEPQIRRRPPDEWEKVNALRDENDVSPDQGFLPGGTDLDASDTVGIGTTRTHKSYFIGSDPEGVDMGELSFVYDRRGSVETPVRHLKRDYMPQLGSGKLIRREYILMFGALIRNIHVLVRRCRSAYNLQDGTVGRPTFLSVLLEAIFDQDITMPETKAELDQYIKRTDNPGALEDLLEKKQEEVREMGN